MVRKIKEALIAIYLENRYTKPELLKLYFDRAYLGGGSYGVEAAAQYYFNKSIREVNLPEAAMLAGMFKAPTRYAPHVNLAASRARANEVLTNMVEAGFMSEGQVYGARMNPSKIVERGDGKTPDYFLDWAFEEVQRLLVGKEDHIVIARTTVDLGLQRAAEEAVDQTIKQFGKSRNFDNGALVSMETDGAVRAIVGGKDYGESQFNRATHAFRQPGSSFKGYVYLTALENGFTPETTVSDSPVSCGRWAPKNYSGGFRGRMTLRMALAKSINTIAVKLSLQAGREKVLANLEEDGHQEHLKKTCSLALGDNGMTPLEHTGGYAVFAAGGLEVRPYAIEEIKTLAGNDVIYNHERDEPARKQIFERKVIEQLNTMLQAVVLEGTGKAAQLDYTYSAGKTGNELGLSRCLVHRLHRPIRHRRLARQRRLHADVAGDRRQLPGSDLARLHGGGARYRQHSADRGLAGSSGPGRRAGAHRGHAGAECRGQSRSGRSAGARERQGHVFGHAAGSRKAERDVEGGAPACAGRRGKAPGSRRGPGPGVGRASGVERGRGGQCRHCA